MDVTAILNHYREESPAAERAYRRNAQRRALQELPTQVNRAPRSPDLTRDDKVGIRAIRKATGWPYPKIAEKMNKTQRQVQVALEGPVTPQKSRSHRNHLQIKTPLRQRIRTFLDEDPYHREIPWPDLRWLVPGLDPYGECAITSAMRKLGFSRKVRKRKIKLTEEHKRKRVEFAC